MKIAFVDKSNRYRCFFQVLGGIESAKSAAYDDHFVLYTRTLSSSKDNLSDLCNRKRKATSIDADVRFFTSVDPLRIPVHHYLMDANPPSTPNT